jgi:Flp pilus assembly protein TadG
MQQVLDNLQNSSRPRSTGRNERGAVLVWFALSLLGLVGFIGAGIDIGRMYVVRNESQAFTDAGALAAAAELDATTAGVTRAVGVAANGWTKYHFSSNAFAAPQVLFATASTGPWLAANALPSPPVNVRFVQVTATVANLPMYLMPILTGQANATIRAMAVAGQVGLNGTSGTFPFSPIGHCSSQANCAANGIPWGDGYGLTIGQEYAFRWSQKSDTDPTSKFCPGDQQANFVNYLQNQKLIPSLPLLGALGPSGANLRTEEVDGLPVNLNVGDSLASLIANGNKVGPSDQGMTARLALDPNTTDYTTYASYLSGYLASGGNGERVVIMPISQFAIGGTDTVLGFGAFLLAPSYPKAGNNYWCAMYLGSGVEWTGRPGGSSTGLFSLRLVK